MSHNLKVYGEREIIVKKTGEETIQRVLFEIRQTTTNLTHAILDKVKTGASVLEALELYKEDVLRYSEDEIMYKQDENWDDTEEVDYIFNSGKEHIEELEKWIAEVTEKGYEIKLRSN